MSYGRKHDIDTKNVMVVSISYDNLCKISKLLFLMTPLLVVGINYLAKSITNHGSREELWFLFVVPNFSVHGMYVLWSLSTASYSN